MTKKLFVLIIFLATLLRFFKLGQVPVSLYWDEASLGFNAYTIATTLKDEHGEFLPVSNFIAFGDFKAPGYIYADSVVVKLFGLSELSVRLPSALAGVLLVGLTYFLAYELFKNRKVALLAMTIVAVSPWSLQMSRAAFEANLAAFLSGAGFFFFLKFIRTKSIVSVLMSAVFLALSLYTFNSQRMFVPLMVAALSLIFFKILWQQKKQAIVFYLLVFVLLIPLIPFMLSREGRLRLTEVTWLNDAAPVELSNKLIAQNNNALWAKVIYNRRVFYTQMFISHYFDNFRPDFLFKNGDVNPRLSVGAVGEMYWFEVIFVLLGLLVVLKNRNKFSAVILAWLILSPVPAALARETPHALRTLNILPMPQILAALGIFFLVKNFKKLGFIICLAYLAGILYYLNYYYFQYPQKSAEFWQYGYKQMVTYVESVKKDYDHVYITDFYGRPYIYFLFYGHQDLNNYWQTRDFSRDWYGFRFVRGFDKYRFGETGNNTGKNLYVSAPNEDRSTKQVVKTINDPYGKIIFKITKN